MKTLRYIFLALFSLCAAVTYAQASCDKLYASGVKYQQTMTIASQNKAISYFEKAKVCYDSQARKDLCTQQVTACRNIIVQISKSSKAAAPAQEATPVQNSQPAAAAVETKPARTDITISFEQTYLKFKCKGGEFKKAKVKCNYPDWEITEMPSWVKCSRNDNEIVVEADKNTNKEERSANIVIQCGDKTATLTIIQEKFKKFIVI